ncbi:MAG: SEL1-like repeat protein [Clostridia bacterium]|nr:SEL1-like repeat protein [Clostridia bacterium]
METVYSKAGEILRKAVNENGPEIFQDIERIEECLKQGQCDQTVRCQVLLFLQTSNVTRYIPQRQTGISMMDINNIIYRTEIESGLNKDTVKKLLLVILFALSLPTSLETVAIPTGTGVRYDDRMIEPASEYEKTLSIIRSAVDKRDVTTLKAWMPELDRMADNGYADALYQKGLCYYYACGVEADIQKAIQYFEAAAHNGSIPAYASLGDCYFQGVAFPDYTKAFEYYTALGAVAPSKERRQNLQVILEEKRVNIRLLIANAILVAGLLIFNVFFASGAFSAHGDMHVVAAILSSVMVLAAFALSILSFIKRRYNSIRWSTPLIFILAMICVFIAI